MTINTQTRTAGPFIGNGAVVGFPFAFKVFQASDLLVTSTDTSGVQSTLVLSADYSVTLNADQNTSPGGVVQTLTPLPYLYQLSITSNVPLLQPVSLTNGGGFYPRVIEDEFDRLTILLQQLDVVSTQQALRVPELAGVDPLPPVAGRANKLLSFDDDGEPVAIAPAGGSAAGLQLLLANALDPNGGPGALGFNPFVGVDYPDGTLGAWINVLVSRSPAEIAAGVTPSAWQYDEGDVRRYGGVFDGVTDDAAAWQSAFTVIMYHGGIAWAPPRPTLVNSPLSLSLLNAYPNNKPGNWKVQAYGTEMLAGPGIAPIGAQSGYIITAKQSGSAYTQSSFEGMLFNTAGNTVVQGCIDVQFGAHLVFDKVAFAMGGQRAGWAGFRIGPSTPGSDNTNSFWTRITNATFGLVSGARPSSGVLLLGAANATVIDHCQFANLVRGISMQTDGVGVSTANALVVDSNAFEGVNIGYEFLGREAAAGGFFPVGLRIVNNRGESMDTFVSINILGSVGAANNHSTPPILRDNYLTAGSVTTRLNNPFGAIVQDFDVSYYGPVTDTNSTINGNANLRMNGNLDIANYNGDTGYGGGHFVMGGYHFWVNPATGKLMTKAGVPTSNTDGTVVGSQT